MTSRPLQLEFMIFGLELVLRQVDDRIIFVDLHQHLLAIEADLVAVHVAQDRLLAILQAVGTEMPLLLAGSRLFVLAAGVADRPAEVEDAAVHQSEVPIVGRSDFEANDAVLNPIRIDLDRYRLLRFFLFLAILLFALLALSLSLSFFSALPTSSLRGPSGDSVSLARVTK